MIENPLIVVDRDRFRLEVWEQGKPEDNPERVFKSECAVGMKGHITPRGVFRLGGRTRTPDWKAGEWAEAPVEPNKVYPWGDPLNPYDHGLIVFEVPKDFGYAIHGVKSWMETRGRVSHGCIRVPGDTLDFLYEQVGNEALVVIL